MKGLGCPERGHAARGPRAAACQECWRLGNNVVLISVGKKRGHRLAALEGSQGRAWSWYMVLRESRRSLTPSNPLPAAADEIGKTPRVQVK